ncbi:DNA-binding protein [Puteibacter caeruleilacunae]|nr:DNA-binding protein [Puteibacter caeruleilacunae]
MKYKLIHKLLEIWQNTHIAKVLIQANNQKLTRIERALQGVHLHQLLTPEQICTRLHISERTLRKVRNMHDIRTFTSGRKLFLNEADVIRALEIRDDLKLNKSCEASSIN